MKTNIILSALAVAVLTAGVAPSTVEAKPKKVYKKVHRHNHKVVKNYYNHGPYRYHRPKYKDESYGIYMTPGGGLGFHYSENSRRHSYPYYW